MKSRIVWKLVACFAAVLLLFAIVSGIIFFTLFRQHTITINRDSMEKRATSIAQTLASFNYSSGKGKNGVGGYGAYLRFLDEIAMAEIWIVDKNLDLITRGYGQHEITYSELPEHAEQIVQRVFEGELTYSEAFSPILGAPSLTVGAPITIDGTIIGAVLLHSPISGIDEAVKQGITTLAAGTGIALVLSGLAALLLSYHFTRPLRQMKKTALRLSDGDYTAKTNVTQKDEIGQLATMIDMLSSHLAQAEEDRKALDQLKENFVENISHELRTPVAVLRGSLEVLQDGTIHEPDEVADYYEQMLSESRHLERLVNDLLDLSRLQDIHFHLDMEEVNLCDIMRDAARTIRRSAHKKQISIQLVCPEEVCMVHGDYGRIRQLLLILLDNAVKFSNMDGTVELDLTTDNRPVLTVTDHGAGISSEELPYIFERFHKSRSPQNKTGTGLGLAIAKEIADRHRAEIHVESNVMYTRFTVLFPEIYLER